MFSPGIRLDRIRFCAIGGCLFDRVELEYDVEFLAYNCRDGLRSGIVNLVMQLLLL